MPTISKENYLKSIYSLNLTYGESVSTSQVAMKLEITNAATSEMARKLAKQGYLHYEKYKGVELTEKGRKIALQIIRRHRLWEVFLIKVLGLSWSEVHDEAEKLEHNTSEELINKIDKHLNYPEFDPHGHPIPNEKGEIPQMPVLVSLLEATVGKNYKIFRVADESSELIEYLTKLNLFLYQDIKIIEKLSFDNSIIVQVNGTNHSLSEKVAEKVSVSILK
ncbi:MAG: metal-dependent transcriptional regulator [Bacteroidetes bacterium]|nr:metal-dependent transcriptional regulator [Bacteroidota bacterium]